MPSASVPPTDERSGPNTAKLLELGFDLGFTIEREDPPIGNGPDHFISRAKLLATPARGEALRRFSTNGQASGETLSNLDVEAFAYELSQGGRALRDLYTEKCARQVLNLVGEQPAAAIPDEAAA